MSAQQRNRPAVASAVHAEWPHMVSAFLGRVNSPTTPMTHLADYFGDPVSDILQHKSCTQTTIKFVCWMLPLMKYQNGVAVFVTDVITKSAPI